MRKVECDDRFGRPHSITAESILEKMTLRSASI